MKTESVLLMGLDAEFQVIIQYQITKLITFMTALFTFTGAPINILFYDTFNK